MGKLLTASLVFLLPLLGAQYGTDKSNTTPAGSSLTTTLFVANGGFGTNPSTSKGLTGLTTSDFLVIWGETHGTGLNTPSGCGTTFTLQGTPSGSPVQTVWTSPSTTTGSCTLSLSATSGGGTEINLAIYVVHGTTQTFNAISSYQADTGFCTSCTGAALTTTGSNRMALFFAFRNAAATSVASLSPYTQDNDSVPAGSGTEVFEGHVLQVSAGTITPTWSNTLVGDHYSDVSISVY